MGGGEGMSQSLSDKQRRVIERAQSSKWNDIGRVDIPASEIASNPSNVIKLYLSWQKQNFVDLAEALSAFNVKCTATDSREHLLALIARWRKEMRTVAVTPVKKVLRYWLAGLESIDWEALADTSTLQAFANLQTLQSASDSASLNLPPGTDLLVLGKTSQRAICSIHASLDDRGAIQMPSEEPWVLLNPRFFPMSEALVDQNTIVLSSKVQFDAIQHGQSWREYVTSIASSFEAAGVDMAHLPSPKGQRQVTWYVVAIDQVDSYAIHVINTYRRLLARRTSPALLSAIVEGIHPSATANPVKALAHVDRLKEGVRDSDPLDSSQRRAVQHAVGLGEGQVLVVNGPPGTGKTTFLRDVIASLWTAPLVSIEDPLQAQPPVIIATGATNQAVTNISSAFDSTAFTEPDNSPRLDQRWLPGISSYGWFAASTTRSNQETRQMIRAEGGQLTFSRVGDEIATIANPQTSTNVSRDTILDNLRRQYCETASAVLQETFRTPDDVIQYLVNLLKQSVATEWTASPVLKRHIPYVSEETLYRAHHRIAEIRSVGASSQVKATSVARRAVGTLREIVLYFWHLILAEVSFLRLRRRSVVFHQWRQSVFRVLDTGIPPWWKLIMGPKADNRARNNILEALKIGDQETIRRAVEEFEEAIVMPMRFHLAARAWEGVWLLRQGSRRVMEARSARRQIQEAAMLAPCVISTLHSLPRLCLMDGGAEDLAIVDLLIIDEASQATSEISGASFAFARRALVVGDEKQLSPVWGMDDREDREMRKAFRLPYLHEALRLSSGSSLAMAQRVTLLPDATPPGVLLIHNYRSLPAIVGFCNELSYSGLLVPSRDLAKSPCPSPWPPMSYVLTDGSYDGEPSVAQNENGWHNDREADAIVGWLKEERASLEARYHKPIHKIVAVLTPFARQEAVLQHKLKAEIGCPVGQPDGMVVGTVHKLQGAERPIVLFSTVVTRSRNSPWLRSQVALLNVAVSRAQDSFVVFGDKKVLFEGGVDSPLSMLGAYLLLHGERLYPRELLVIEARGKRDHIQTAFGARSLVIATNGSVRDLPEDASDPVIRWIETQPHVLDRIAQATRDVRPLVFATDDDREGEAIAWHVLDALKRRGVDFGDTAALRMRFSSLSPEALRQARAAAGHGLDMRRVNASILRHLIDYAISHDYHLKAGLSDPIGRVQAALLLSVLQAISHQEKTVRIRADARSEDGTQLTGYLVDDRTSVARPQTFKSEGEGQAVAAGLDASTSTDLGLRSIQRHAPDLLPADTAAVLAAAARELGLPPSRTMEILEDLYLGRQVVRS